MDDATLRIGGTGGLVARRGAEMLFVPAGSEEVVRAFEASTPGGAVEAVTALCERGEGEVGAFVVADWTVGLRLAVNGDIDVTSNQPSLPRLNAAGAGTWVERSLRSVEAPVALGVAVDSVHPNTNLVVGVAVAGAFQLELELAPSSASPAADEGDLQGRRMARHQQETFAPMQDAAPTRSEPTDPASPPLPAEAVSMADDVLGGSQPAAPPSYELGSEEETIVPDERMRSLVDSLSDDEVAPPSRHAEWQLRIVDRGIEPIQGTTILGRSPAHRDGDDPAATHLIEIEGSHLSRSHLAVEVVDGTILLVDLGSRNGSFIVTSGDSQLVQLEPGVARRVDAGTVAQIGSVRFFVERRP